MIRASRRVRLVVALLAAGGATGCAGGAAQAQTFSDPFAYCSAVGTIDAPDARYAGPAVPGPIARGLRAAFGAPPDAPAEMFVRGTSWRCMDGQVYACNVGANLPCQGRADTRRTPAPPLVEFCRDNRNADVVPMVVSGRETVYEWRCADGAPRIVRQIATPDARGFLSDIWYRIAPPR